MRNALTALYSVIWGAVIIIKQLQGEAVNMEMLGWLAMGVIVLRIAFRDDDKTRPPGDEV